MWFWISLSRFFHLLCRVKPAKKEFRIWGCKDQLGVQTFLALLRLHSWKTIWGCNWGCKNFKFHRIFHAFLCGASAVNQFSTCCNGRNLMSYSQSRTNKHFFVWTAQHQWTWQSVTICNLVEFCTPNPSRSSAACELDWTFFSSLSHGSDSTLSHPTPIHAVKMDVFRLKFNN